MRSGAPFAALALLAGCTQAGDRCAQPPVKLCDVPLPPPVVHHLVPAPARGRDVPPHPPGTVLRRLVPSEGEGRLLYLISDGQAPRGTLVGAQPQSRPHWSTIAQDVDLARVELVARPSRYLDMLALRERTTGIGVTYVIDDRVQTTTYAADSKLVHDLWWGSRNSSCGGGPLTRIPAEVERNWQAEYDAFLARLRAECEAKRPLWNRIVAAISRVASK